MPTFPILSVGDWVQARLVGIYEGQVCINTFLWKLASYSAEGASLDLKQVGDALLGKMWDDLGAPFRAVMVSSYVLQELSTQVISPIRTFAYPAVPVNPAGGVDPP